MSKDSRASEIRAVFEQHGGLMPVAELARACVADGVYSPDEMQHLALKAIQNECRGALKGIDLITGLPYAGPSASCESGEPPVWKQLDFFEYEDFAQMLIGRCEGLKDDYSKVVTLYRWGIERFGKAPEIPALQMPVAF